MNGTEKQIAWANEIIEIANIRLAEAKEFWTAYREEEIARDERRKASGKPDRSEQNTANWNRMEKGFANLEKAIAEADDAAHIIENRGKLVVRKDDKRDILRWTDDASVITVAGIKRFA